MPKNGRLCCFQTSILSGAGHAPFLTRQPGGTATLVLELEADQIPAVLASWPDLLAKGPIYCVLTNVPPERAGKK